MLAFIGFKGALSSMIENHVGKDMRGRVLSFSLAHDVDSILSQRRILGFLRWIFHFHQIAAFQFLHQVVANPVVGFYLTRSRTCRSGGILLLLPQGENDSIEVRDHLAAQQNEETLVSR